MYEKYVCSSQHRSSPRPIAVGIDRKAFPLWSPRVPGVAYPYADAMFSFVARRVVFAGASVLLIGACLSGCVADPDPGPMEDATSQQLEPTSSRPAEVVSAFNGGPASRIAVAPGIDPSQTLLYFVQFFFEQSERERGGWRQVVTEDASALIDAAEGPTLYQPQGTLTGDETIKVVIIREGKGVGPEDTESTAQRTADVLLEREDGTTTAVTIAATLANGPDWFTDSVDMQETAWAEQPGWRLEWTEGSIVQTEQ